MSTRRRLDAELVRRGLARSREHAAELVTAGRVVVAGQSAGKTATQVTADDPIAVTGAGAGPEYASRGGRKLAGALAAFPALSVAGRRCLDAGASTGGFTDVLLRAGAAQVVAVDVGYGQLAWALRSDRPGHRARPGERAAPGAGPGGAAAVPGHRGPVVHLAQPGAARPGPLRRPGRRLRAAGQAPVRGGQGACRRGRGGARPRVAGRRRDRGGRRRRRQRPGRGGRHRQPAARAGRERGVFPLAAPRCPPLEPSTLAHVVAEGPQ